MADNKLPVFKLTIKDDGGVDFVALVDKPAIEECFLAFSKHEKIKFAVTDTEQRILSGPLMIPDMLIFRDDAEHGPHSIFFDSDTIKNIVLKFFADQNTGKVNLMHDPKALPDGVFMFESFITDSKRGINAPVGFEKLPDGTWFGSYKVNNDTLWNDFIKTGEIKGFSIEGFFAYEPADVNEENELINKINTILQAVE